MRREIRYDSKGLNDQTVYVTREYNTSGANKGKLHRVSEPYYPGTTTIPWAETYTYNSDGRILYRQTPLGTDTIEYNYRITTVVTPESTKSTTLNTSGFTESSTVNGKAVNYTYYPNGLTKTATPQNGQALTMEYDPHGNRLHYHNL
ncbi:MAG: hypothetical protein LBH19_13130 [Dysgonamonadaceae bacterium]|jgi:lipopolysaccharide export system protein LptA|nr:hypothetical protein [Dysgonamonadaceae bacterium]